MNKWNFEELEMKGAYLITPFFADDNRGGFLKDYSKEVFEQNGIVHDLKEVFYTISHKGVIRAIHFQRIKQQAKLVRCVSGKIFDVISTKNNDVYWIKEPKELLIPVLRDIVLDVDIDNQKVLIKCVGEWMDED